MSYLSRNAENRLMKSKRKKKIKKFRPSMIHKSSSTEKRIRTLLNLKVANPTPTEKETENNQKFKLNVTTAESSEQSKHMPEEEENKNLMLNNNKSFKKQQSMIGKPTKQNKR
ncbi:hypothetical protein AVEN_53169-1 [Araneus ventricosus]|uniref:Uncharacterized protein n=1 Tax=Araneus ventricosus TaxID=182803 RepID=A0A4Y2A944_ARAVE|nr:hypothetical protein AVEN_53169-1 [Araneus ventricosus]